MAPAAAHAAEGIISSIDVNSMPPFWRRKNGILLYFLLTSSLLASAALGIDGSMTNGMQVLESWQDRFGHPEGATLGFFGASNAIGGVIPFIFLGWIGDKYGRRLPTALGSIIIITGVIVEFFATSLNMYIGGKIVLGIGSSLIQMGAPVLITELSHPKERVQITTFYNTSIVLGYVIGAWATFGCYRITNQWSWRLPTLIQIIPSAYQFCLIWFCPESPRWLIAKGRIQEARQILIKFHGECDPNSELVAVECTEIQQAIDKEAENNMSWKDFFSSRANLKRLFLCFATAVFSQSSGNLLVSNYLTQILKDTGLKTQSEITLMNGMVTLWQYVVAIFVALVVDKFRRRFFFLTGSGGVVVTFVVWTIAAQQYLEHNSLVAGRVVIACIFFFQAFYTFAWTNLIVTYPLEVVTLQMRAKTWAFVLLTIQVASIFGSYVNPIGLKSLGWKFYIYYCVWVLVVFLVVYFFFVETAGPTLEELAYLFEGEDIKRGIVDKVAKQKEQVQYEEHVENKSA
ncbi:Major facilitator superfamily domain, general substrate transporter [Penicillium griseofulvum]|uniref:Major facilitator superfamily domain, general substrate transporter n=1 Tax=Penicillium patulum TaxID=5078 RepID=A0A135LUE9_PENPA|nr:Major facilitator superfamily domain, general substrate transporter [Penicillium griseofulvum]KXG52580.1 Major facilitator superfamily domain, general substrate transporter [Penicillium griseofulvum]